MSLVITLRKLAFNKKRRAETWRLIADLLDSDLSLAEALETSANVARLRGQGSVAKVLIDIREAIPRGEFAQRAADYTSGPETMLFGAVGSADEKAVFEAAYKLATQGVKTTQAIQAAIAMPVLLCVGLGVMFYALGSQLYPSLAEISPMASWGFMPQVIAGFSIWFSSHITEILVTIAAIVLGFYIILPSWKGLGRNIADRIVPFSLYKMQVGTGFIFTVTELGKMGISLNSRSLQQLTEFTSPYVRSRITAITDGLTTKRLGQAALDAGHSFPAKDINAVLSAMDNRDEWIFKFSKFLDRWLDQYEYMIKVQTRVLNFLLMGAVAGAIGVTMTSTLSIMQTLQQ